jgi:N-acetyl-alpha-D-muramate 1-phosphate uridylyltransferase
MTAGDGGHAAASMTAMVMAAGKGTRMRPLTADRPKPLVTVAGRPLIDHVLDHLRAAGVRRIVVNVHYLAEQIEMHLAAHAADFDVAISDERGALLETGGGLIKARALLGALPFFCVNTDNIWTDDGPNAFTSLASQWDDDRMDALLLLAPHQRAQCHAGRGDFDMAADGRISRMDAAAAKQWVWTGVQMLHPRLLIDPPADVFSTNIFWDRAIAAGRAFGAVHHGAWIDVGTPEAIPVAEAALHPA